MGGAQWGVLLPREGGHAPFLRYLLSVLPALLAFLCLLIPSMPGLIGLVVGFLALLTRRRFLMFQTAFVSTADARDCSREWRIAPVSTHFRVEIEAHFLTPRWSGHRAQLTRS